MSTIDPTLPASGRTDTAPQPPAPAPARRKPVNKLLLALIAVSVLAVILAVTTILQHDAAVDARASLAETRSDLRDTESDLSTTETDLADAEATVAEQEEQLAACADVVDVSDHQYEQLQLLADAVTQSLDFNFTRVTAKLDVAKPHADQVNEIIEAGGFSDWGSFFAACAPDHKLL